MNGVHLVVFCAVDYESLLNDCVASAKKYIKDDILSITIASNGPLKTQYRVILDQDFWCLLDPKFEYSNLYKHNWVKQQILKLNLDRLFTGNILSCDVEVRFKQPIQWTENDKFNIFYTDEPMGTSPVFVNNILGLNPKIGYVTEAILFNSKILCNLRDFVENKFGCNQLEAYRNLVYDAPESETPLVKVFMSEYELYNNYVMQNYAEQVLESIKHTKDIYSSVTAEIQTKYKTSQTQWISFYEQVRSPEWPECYKEEDFINLPEYIQQECISVHGYKPKKLTTK